MLTAASIRSTGLGSDVLRGNLDKITLGLDGSLEVNGWAVDPQAQGGGRPPVTVAIEVDGKEIYSAVANVSRPGGWPVCAPIAHGRLIV